MSDSIKTFIDRILYAVVATAVVIFAFGMIFAVRWMTTTGLYFTMIFASGISAMTVYEYLWRNTEPEKNKRLLVEMIVAVVLTLAVISLSIFFFNGKILTLPQA